MLDRIVGDPFKKLTESEKLQLADLRKHGGFEILERITEDYVRGYVVDNLLATSDQNASNMVSRAQGIAQGARWVIDRVLIAHNDKIKKKDSSENVDARARKK